MRVRLGGESWPFDEEKLTLADAFVIKAGCGLGMAPFMAGLAQFDPDCVQTLIWFLRRPAEPALRREDVDFQLADLDIDEVEVPPTGADSTTSTGSVTDTSGSSPIS